MFGNFTFGEGYFGQPEASSFTGSGSLVQQSQTCSGTGTVINPVSTTAASCDQKTLDKLLGKKRKNTKKQKADQQWVFVPFKPVFSGSGALVQPAQTINGSGSIGFSGRGKLKQHRQKTDRQGSGRICFRGSGAIKVEAIATRGSGSFGFCGSGKIEIRRRRPRQEEDLALILMLAGD